MDCTNCGRELKTVFINSEFDQYEDAMHLKLVPGYGEYFDGNAAIDIFLCGNCASGLLDHVMPNIKEYIYDELDKQGF